MTGGDAGREEVFANRDANRDGIVTKDEVLAYGRKAGVANRVMRGADANKDGRLTVEELKAFGGTIRVKPQRILPP